jgi:hypothetical protein
VIPEAGLPGGASERGAVRVGDTVRRPPGPAAELVREVLRRLESAGFEEAPRRRGRAEQGRDVLTWIEGDTHTDRSRLHPYVGDPPDRVLFADEQLAAALRLLRRYHAALAGDLVCHGGFGPWNLVWRDGLPVAVIDVDRLRDASPDRLRRGRGRARAPARRPLTAVASPAAGRRRCSAAGNRHTCVTQQAPSS